MAPEGRKVGSLKRRVRSQLATGAMKNCTPLWRKAHLQVKMYKTPGVRTTFGSYDVEKVHAVVARSTFPSQNVQSTPWSDHFWKLMMSKKCTPLWREAHQVKMYKAHSWSGPLLEVEMSKKCTPLWREAHFQVKMYKAHHGQVRTTFGSCQNVRCRKSARRCGAKQISKSKVLKTGGLGPLLEVQMSKKCRKSARRCGAKHISKSKV